MARVPENIRLREHRELFQRAVRENVTMDEARRRTSAERWARTDAHLSSRKLGDCESAERQPTFWWQ